MMQTAADVQQQYDQSGHAPDLEFAIDTWSRLRDLVQREPRAAAAVLGHDMTARALNELGLDLLDSARRAAGTERFHAAAEVLYDAADWAEPGSRWRTDALVNASHVLMACWERSAAAADLDAAVAAAEAAIAAEPATPASRAVAMNVLGNALRTRGRSGSRTEDLRRAVDAHAEAVEITGSGTPDTARFLVNLGHVQRALAAATGDAALLEAAVTTFGDARREVSDERDLIPALEGLQESLGARGAPADLLAQADVLTSIASEHAGQPALAATDLILKSHVLRSLGAMTKDAGAIEKAMAAARRARELSAPDPDVHASACKALAQALSARFEVTRSQQDLDESIALLRRAVTGDEPDAHVPGGARARVLTLLGRDLRKRYELTGESQDADEGLQVATQALERTELGDAGRAGRSMDLGWWLSVRHQLTDDGLALDQAIARYQEARDALEPGSPSWLRATASLGAMLVVRFEASGNRADIDTAVELTEAALSDWEHVPDSWLLRPALANELIARQGTTGGDADLDRALALFESVPSHPRMMSRELVVMLTNAARALARRAERTGSSAESDRALRIAEEATKLSLPPHLRAAALRNLSALLLDRAGTQGSATIAREAARVAGEAAALTSGNSVAHAATLELRGVVEQLLADLEDRPADNAVALLEQALAATDSSSPAFRQRLVHLAGALAACADRDSDAPEATRALAAADRALTLIGEDNVLASGPLRHRATALRVRFRLLGDDADRVAATAAFRAALDAAGSARLRSALATAREWQRWSAERDAWNEAIEAGERGLALATALLRRQVGRVDREGALDQAPIIAGDQAYALARTGRLREAVVVLEHGRALLLAESLRRNLADLTALRAEGQAALADRFEAAVARIRALEAAETRSETAVSLERPWASFPPELERDRSAELAAVTEELERVITAVRNVPGREHFLAGSEFPAPRSPLVYLTGTTDRGLSLIVHSDGQVEALWLPQLAADEVRARVRTWLTAYDARAEDPSRWAHTFDATLRWAWTAAMGRVAECLRGQERATLVPGGLLGLLPLHAAWISDSATPGGRRYALDELLLSYTPSAAILEEVSVGVPVHAPRSLLAVADPQPVSAAPLPWARREASNAARCFSSVKLLAGPQATRTAVAEHLDGHDVLHFACHGFADPADPQQSALILADDEPLTLADLASMRLTAAAGERPRLAVLSACESGMPGGALPDEVVGLPAGLLSAGVHGVVSSLVTVPDAATGLLMTRFYETWTGGHEPMHALRDAQRWLRDATNEQLYASFGEALTGTPPVSPAARRLWATARPFAHPVNWAAFTYVGT